MADDIPDDVKKQALDAVGTMASTMPSAPQLEEPPAPVEGLPPPQLEQAEPDDYEAVLMSNLAHELPEPSDSGMESFLVEDVEPGEPITPLPTPDIDIEPD